MSHRSGVAVVLFALVWAVPSLAGAPAAADPAPPMLRITPTGFDFGDVPIGTSRARVVSVTNPSGAPIAVSTGGGAAGPFGGVQNCQGRTLAPGESCQITYTLRPVAIHPTPAPIPAWL